ncbi:MAG: ATP-binding protein [Bacteroidales bacterium]
MTRLQTISVTILIIISISVNGQYKNLKVERISVGQGLNVHRVTSIIRDRKGFIWLGTNNGIYKYDGYEFQEFKSPPNCQNYPAHPFRTVSKIIQDSAGFIWVSAVNGLFLIDPVTERSAWFPGLVDRDKPLFHYLELEPDMVYGSRGTLWITGPQGPIRISPRVTAGPSLSHQDILFHPDSAYHVDFFRHDAEGIPFRVSTKSIDEDQWGNIWTTYNRAIYCAISGSEGFDSMISWDQIAPGSPEVKKIAAVNDRGLAIATSVGLYLLTYSQKALGQLIRQGDTSGITMTKILDQDDIMSLEPVGSDELLIGTEFDLLDLHFYQEKEKVTVNSLYEGLTDPDQKGYLIGVGDLLKDPTDVIWAGRFYYGLDKILMSSNAFTSYKPLITKYFSNTDVNPLHVDSSGNIWAGTFGDGLYHVDVQSGIVRNFKPGDGSLDVECLVEAKPGIFWIGLRGGVLLFDANTGKFTDPIPPGKIREMLKSTYVLNIAVKDHLVFLGTMIGLFALDTRTGQVRHISVKPPDAGVEEFGFRSLLVTRDGELWTECDRGVCRIEFTNLNDIEIIPIVKRDEQKDLFLVFAYFLYEDSEGYIWYSSETQLTRIDRKSGKTKDFTPRDPHNPNTPLAARSIQEDAHSNFWIGTQFGLCQLNKKTGAVRLFDQSDGLPILIHGHLSTSRVRDGSLYFGGIGGFYRFHPDSVRLNRVPPPVVLTDLRLFNEPIKVGDGKDAILSKSISYTEGIRLKHDQNNLEIEFAALDYSDPAKNQYAYTLENFQEDWIFTDAGHRTATYTSLEPGKYIFRVKASNNHQIWNETGISLSVRIYPPWYKTAVAYILYGLILVLSVAGFIYVRTRRLVQEKKKLEAIIASRTHDLELVNQQLEQQKTEIQSQKDCLEESHKRISELDRLKTRFFTNISHEFRTMLTLIKTPVRNLVNSDGIHSDIRRSLNMVDRNVGKLTTLVNQLLDISRIDRGRVRLMLSSGNVQYFLRSVAVEFKATSEVRGIDYRLKIHPDVTITWFDADKLEKILNNLLSNAFKFTDEGGQISVESMILHPHETGTGHRLSIAVSNSGIGIPGDEQEKIFDRFYQAESGLKTEGGGTGIGLALVSELVHLLHGYITVESEVNKETTFKVELPLGKEHLTEDEYTIVTGQADMALRGQDHSDHISLKSRLPGGPLKENGGPVNEERSKVLIVEDNEEIRWLVAERFKSEFFILEAVDGSAGLKLALEKAPDLVITDLMMPRMDGTELCRRLKMNLETSHIPVIMLTAKATQDQKLEGLEAGADDYIPKPFDIRELEVRAKNLVDQRRILREKFSSRITLDPGEITITPLDEQFLKRAMEVVASHLSDDTFDVKAFREVMHMSRSTLTRKLQALTNQAPVEFIRTMRLKRAADLLEMGFGNVTEVAMEVGFSNPSYFSKMFRKTYQVSPADYLKACKTKSQLQVFTDEKNQ